MSWFKNRYAMMLFGSLCLLGIVGLSVFRIVINKDEVNEQAGTYEKLSPDTCTEDPLQYIEENFTVKEGFHTNLPIVILNMDGEISDYKSFKDAEESVYEDVDPYTTGTMEIIDNGQDNYLNDDPIYSSSMEIKKRGHTSYSYDKAQYLIKTLNDDGSDNDTDILGMGKGDSWVLNGSMADKSMIRNYLPYRIASEIDRNSMAPDSRFCEVLLKKDGYYEYSGVYLLMETVDRGSARVDIQKYKSKDSYSSYIVRRDRFTNFDVMLDTYGRLYGYSDQWIGVKYPSGEKLTDTLKTYIEKDFSKTEQIVYSDDEQVFKIYDKYINVDSFIDYFLINEYFGNYDAGEHSTYMYKNAGEILNIGPVWDFDQAMNNYYEEEMKPKTLAFQDKPFFDRLTKDKEFVDSLKKRYAYLINNELSEEHVFSVIDETTEYLTSARQREWFRWAADYEDGSFENPHNYYLQDYTKKGEIISRFNDNYDQEIYNIKNYLHVHGNAIQPELTKLYKGAKYDTSLKSENKLFLLIILTLFFVPSIFINRKG